MSLAIFSALLTLLSPQVRASKWQVFRAMPAAVSIPLEGVAAGGAELWVVRAGATALHWDGRSWGEDGEPYLVAGRGRDVWRFADGPAGVVAGRRTGRAWVDQELGVPDTHVTAAVVTGPADVWASGLQWTEAGMRDIAWRWNGKVWRRVTTPHPVTAYAATGPADVWAVSSIDRVTRFQHWDGSAWTVTTLPEAEIKDVVALSPAEAYAVGSVLAGSRPEGAVFRWNGKGWSRLARRVAGVAYTRVAADGAGGVWMVEGPSFVNLRKGRWTRHPVPVAQGEVKGIVAGAGRMWAVAESSAGQYVLTYQDGP
ncbi:hypothetical protein Aph01nite_74910 [Acrocarpospora phusangensis]|uniref:Photosynthesis system II assembly factor Ycf48/Hcf136-like domain-containing protein n=1 Tax=Acrocarpospora phusangensis TaxID=1070424 RepID=A0A919QJX2_9ACTN|nr:hypothetical protein [Acrocarpospora phusangensis]GIH29181.1 hypothetical protein Aph01nite_74910 [Acrocarpospora phusangensis]